MAISSLKQNSLTFPWLLAQNKIPWLFPDFSLTIIFFPVFPVFQTLWEPWLHWSNYFLVINYIDNSECAKVIKQTDDTGFNKLN